LLLTSDQTNNSDVVTIGNVKISFARNIRYEEDLLDQLFNSSEKRLASVWGMLVGKYYVRDFLLLKRNRRPKSAKRIDYTARTMAAVRQLEEADKIKMK
jgi:hypothetical protein